MKPFIFVLVGLHFASAFPGMAVSNHGSRAKSLEKRAEPSGVRQPAFLSNRKNTGIGDPKPTFNAAAQYVDTRPGSGHEFQAPGPNDKRGPCPALNAAANHNFIPHNGIVDLPQALSGLSKVFNIGPEIITALWALGVVYGGDILSGTFSSGGPYQILLSNPKGITNTHNVFEGDGSPTRGDAFFNGGNGNAFSIPYFEHLYSLGPEVTHDTAAAHGEWVQQTSKQFNPYFFQGLIGAVLVTGTEAFMVDSFSNHSAENPGGTLTREDLKSWYSVTGSPGSFVYKEGHERIPDKWYRRPKILDLQSLLRDILKNNEMYPGQISVGGNTGKPNTFTGVDLSDLTGGVYNAQTLLQGNNLACFLLQATQQAIPNQLGGIISSVGALVQWLTNKLAPIISDLSCPQLSEFHNELFDIFPKAPK